MQPGAWQGQAVRRLVHQSGRRDSIRVVSVGTMVPTLTTLIESLRPD